MSDIKIIYKDKDLIAIIKPVGMPSQADPTGDADALTSTSAFLASQNEASELFLLHRLDRGVGGVLIFARNKKAAAAVSEIFAQRLAEKEYFAAVRGECEGGVYRDLLYKDAKQGKSFVVKSMRSGVREAELSADPISSAALDGKDMTLMRVSLKTGRHHQIRVQFSSRRHPLVGDKKYGDSDARTRFPALFATSLRFSLGGRDYRFDAVPDASAYPWCHFQYFLKED